MKKTIRNPLVERRPGCSQEHHIPNCSHFGFTGEYLSAHAFGCPGGVIAECTCNPQARGVKSETPRNIALEVACAITGDTPGRGWDEEIIYAARVRLSLDGWNRLMKWVQKEIGK